MCMCMCMRMYMNKLQSEKSNKSEVSTRQAWSSLESGAGDRQDITQTKVVQVNIEDDFIAGRGKSSGGAPTS